MSKKILLDSEKVKDDLIYAIILIDIGRYYWKQADYLLAKENLRKSLIYWKRFGNDVFTSACLMYIVFVENDLEDIPEMINIVNELKKLKENNSNLIILQRYRLCQALYLKKSTRVKQKVQSQTILEKLSNEKTIDYELLIYTILNLIDILLSEISMTGEEEIIEEIEVLISKLEKKAIEQRSDLLIIEIMIIQSKIALLNLDIDASKQILDEALELAKKIDIKYLIEKIEIELSNFYNQIDTWNSFIDKKAPMSERIQLTQFNTLLRNLTSKNDDISIDDMSDYVNEAQHLINSM